MLISVEETGTSQMEPGQQGCLSVVILFYEKKSLTKTDWCAGAVW